MLDLVRLFNQKEGQCQVYKGILEFVEARESLHELVELRRYAACDHGSGGRDRRDDSACDHLGFAEVALCDLVVAGTELSGGVDVVDVEVSFIVLLKFNRLQLLRLNRLDLLLQLTHQRVEGLFVVNKTDWGGDWWRQLGFFASFGLLRCLNNNLFLDVGLRFRLGSDGSYFFGVSVLGNAKVEGYEVGARLHKH